MGALRLVRRHRTRLRIITCVSIVYAATFAIYLVRLHDLLRGAATRSRFLGSLVLMGGLVFVVLHAVSEVGITGLLAGKIASFGAQHDQGVSDTLYLLTFAIDSVGDVFGSLFALAAGWLVFESRVLSASARMGCDPCRAVSCSSRSSVSAA